ncbi:MAG TPA: hypothetical protein VLA00_16350 [Xanthobacteraceae bacterium]|nr:hypothetical protein [Xanthobacteraceae bacterium]
MIAEASHILSTPVDVFERKPWPEFLEYFDEAKRIAKARQL